MDIRKLTSTELAKYIQFTKTAPNVTREEMVKHFEQCAQYGFNAAMVPMYYVSLGKEIMKGSGVKVATFFGFGMGHETIRAKILLMQECIDLGADEVDYQPNMSAFLSGQYNVFEEETQRLLEVSTSIVIKPMLELGLIPTLEEKIRAIKILDQAGVVWIKNSSGAPTGGGPATAEDIRLLRENVRPECKVKASGKVNSFEKMAELFDAGAELTGSSNGIEIISRVKPEKSDY
ncbi:MAG: deoxyribose-phosphate aldolase [Bacteroidales bacterium]|nr:deoxyribose-phosphate aldolase [Bacteroidales bacterium]